VELTNLKELKALLKQANLRPSKKLAQHFLIDRTVLDEIIQIADLQKTDQVLEIGPGVGVLTRELCKFSSQVIAVESDERLVHILASYHLPNLQIVHQNFLDFNLQQIPKPFKLVANLPYNITSLIFRKVLDTTSRPSLVVALVQREVAERIVASNGKMSVLALSVQYFGRPQIMRLVKSSSFWPQPQVDSAIIKITVFSRPLFDADSRKLFRLIKSGFSAKRKMLKNSLSGGLNISTTEALSILRQAGINPNQRAQQLSLEDWQKLYLICRAKNII